MDGAAPWLRWLRGRLPDAFELDVVVVPAGTRRAFDPAQWRDALVVVEHGEIDLEGAGGTTRRFGPGAVLWLAGLDLRALHNRGRDSAVLLAVSRRTGPVPGRPHPVPRGDEFPARPPSQ